MPEPITPEDFAAVAATALIQDGAAPESVYFDAPNYQLLLKDGHGRVSVTVHLYNFFVQFNGCTDEEQQREVVRQIVEMTKAGATGYPETLEEARDKLFIQIKPRWVFQQDYEVEHLMIGPHMGAAVVYDTGDNFLYINNSILEDWGTTFDDAFDIAGTNLISLGGFLMATDKENSFYHHEADDYFGAARCLCVSTIETLKVKGDHIVAIPHRDHLIVTGSESREGLQFILDCFNELKNEPGVLPPVLLRPTEGYYAPYFLPWEHELHEQFFQLELEYLSDIYDRQKELLNSQFEQLVGKRKVAEFYIGGDNVHFSFSLITPNMVPCLIPETEYVSFGDEESEPVAIVRWDTATRVLADELKDLESYPTRFVLSKFPSDSQIEEMGFEPLPDDEAKVDEGLSDLLDDDPLEDDPTDLQD